MSTDDHDSGFTYGSIAQLGEHLPYKQRVTGSSPVLSTKKEVPSFVISIEVAVLSGWLGSSVG